MGTTVFIDNTEKSDEPRIVRGSLIADLWDVGLDEKIMTRRANVSFNVHTLAALLGSVRQELIDDGELEIARNLDRFSLEAFIRDMTANDFNIAFTDELAIGKRQQPPTLGAGGIVPTIGQVTINAQFANGQDVDKLYVRLLRLNNNQEYERVVDVTLNVAFLAVAVINAPAGEYRGFVAAIDSNGLRGFKSQNIPLFTIL